MKTRATARILVSGAVIALLSTGAMAQTVGEILDKGGQQLDAAAARAIITGGVALAGTTPAGFTGVAIYKADGTVSASGTRGSVSNSGSGNWTIDDSGKVCSKISWSGGGTGGSCHFWFKQGEEYFTAQTDARDQKAIPRPIGK